MSMWMWKNGRVQLIFRDQIDPTSPALRHDIIPHHTTRISPTEFNKYPRFVPRGDAKRGSTKKRQAYRFYLRAYKPYRQH